MKKPNGYKVKLDTKLKAFGETDFNKKVIRINPSKHNAKAYKKEGIAKADRTILNTLVHEYMHANNPSMSEQNVVRQTNKKLSTMSKKSKATLRSHIS